jgi:hypothetical protein
MMTSMQKFSWVDILALGAAVAGALALKHFCWDAVYHPWAWNFVPTQNAFINGIHKARHIADELTPVVFGFAMVGLARVFREPAPHRRLLFRQPGVAACAAIVAALAAGGARTAIWIVFWFEYSAPWATPSIAMVIDLGARPMGFCVLAVWAFLASVGLWTPGRNWVNWLGCAIGLLTVVNLALRCLP